MTVHASLKRERERERENNDQGMALKKIKRVHVSN